MRRLKFPSASEDSSTPGSTTRSESITLLVISKCNGLPLYSRSESVNTFAVKNCPPIGTSAWFQMHLTNIELPLPLKTYPLPENEELTKTPNLRAGAESRNEGCEKLLIFPACRIA